MTVEAWITRKEYYSLSHNTDRAFYITSNFRPWGLKLEVTYIERLYNDHTKQNICKWHTEWMNSHHLKEGFFVALIKKKGKVFSGKNYKQRKWWSIQSYRPRYFSITITLTLTLTPIHFEETNAKRHKTKHYLWTSVSLICWILHSFVDCNKIKNMTILSRKIASPCRRLMMDDAETTKFTDFNI